MPCLAADTGAYTRQEAFGYAEPLSVNAFFNDWSTPPVTGRSAQLHLWSEAGAVYGPWRLGLIYRLDYDLRFTPDTAALVYKIENHRPLIPGERFDIDLKAYHMESRGVRLERRLQPRRNIDVAVGLALLTGQALTDGRIHGQAQAVAANDYDFKLDVDYYYSRDALFDRSVEAPQGSGFSTDLAIHWRVAPQLDLDLRILDLLGRMYWRYAPYTTAQADSHTKQYDDAGYARFSPTISGREGNRDFTQSLQTRADADARLRFGPSLSGLVRIRFSGDESFPGVGLIYASRYGQWQTLYTVNTGALSAGFDNEWLTLGISGDAWNVNDAHTLQAYLGLQLVLR